MKYVAIRGRSVVRRILQLGLDIYLLNYSAKNDSLRVFL